MSRPATVIRATTHHVNSWARSARRLLLTGVVAATVSAGLTVPAAVAPAQASSSARAMQASYDDRVLHFTNVERKKRGLRPLVAASCADRFASRHTQRLAAQDRMYHQSLRPVLRQCGMRTAGENLAWRAPALAPRRVVRMWMNSRPHRANILKAKFRYLGVDAFRSARTGRVYVGQVFGG
jgi:uncharacterized protein YkwD